MLDKLPHGLIHEKIRPEISPIDAVVLGQILNLKHEFYQFDHVISYHQWVKQGYCPKFYHMMESLAKQGETFKKVYPKDHRVIEAAYAIGGVFRLKNLISSRLLKINIQKYK